MRLFITSAVAVLLAAGCATAYKQPERVYGGLTLQHNLEDAEIAHLLKQSLTDAGYSLSPASDETRFVTEPRTVKLNSSWADCGSTLGVYHIDQEEVHTEVVFDIPLRAGEIEFRTHIRGVSTRDGAERPNPFSCTSTGELERRLSQAVKQKIEEPQQ